MSDLIRIEDAAWQRAYDCIQGPEWADEDVQAGRADVIAALLRTVERETAEEIIRMPIGLTQPQINTIKARFGLKEGR